MSAHRVPIHQGRITSPVTLMLGRYVNTPRHPVELAVAQVFNVHPDDMHRHCRGMVIDDARRAAMALMLEYDRIGLGEVGRHFERDHTAVLNAKHRSRALEQTDPRYRAKLNAARAALGI